MALLRNLAQLQGRELRRQLRVKSGEVRLKPESKPKDDETVRQQSDQRPASLKDS